jgi:hypothetical protein
MHRTGNRPLAQDGPVLCIAPLHSPRATEFPVLRSFANFGPDGIPFDVAQNRIKMIVFFDGKRLKSTLVKMPGPFRVGVSVPTHDMGVCQPLKEVRERIFIRWANHKMPVVGHQTVAQKWQRKLGVSFDESPFKCLVVLKFFKQRQPCHGSVEHVETSSARTYTGATRHTGRIKTFSRDVNFISCVPFSFLSIVCPFDIGNIPMRQRMRLGNRNRESMRSGRIIVAEQV